MKKFLSFIVTGVVVIAAIFGIGSFVKNYNKEESFKNNLEQQVNGVFKDIFDKNTSTDENPDLSGDVNGSVDLPNTDGEDATGGNTESTKVVVDITEYAPLMTATNSFVFNNEGLATEVYLQDQTKLEQYTYQVGVGATQNGMSNYVYVTIPNAIVYGAMDFELGMVYDLEINFTIDGTQYFEVLSFISNYYTCEVSVYQNTLYTSFGLIEINVSNEGGMTTYSTCAFVFNQPLTFSTLSVDSVILGDTIIYENN